MSAKTKENGVRTRCAAIANHSAIVNSLCVVNLLRVVFLVRRGPLVLIAKANGSEHFVLAAECPCEWMFATKSARGCICDGLVHSVLLDMRTLTAV